MYMAQSNGCFQLRKWIHMENKKSLREAILYDENDHVAMTIWKNFLEEISEKTMYLFRNIFLKDFYGLKLTTTTTTIVSSEGPASFTLPQDVVTTYKELNKLLKHCLHPKICWPGVVSVILDVFPSCTNILCEDQLLLFPISHPHHASNAIRR